MQTRRWITVATIVISALLIAACAANQGQPQGEKAENLDQLMAALEARGFEVKATETVSQPFFSQAAQILEVNGDALQVYEFTTDQNASTAAATISPDGSSVGTSMVTWVFPPHFYHSGKLLVLYLGEQSDFLAALEEVLGPQIAGR